MKKINKISVVISFLNEINNIPELISRIRVVSKRASNFKIHEIIFVNDCSTDGSEEYLEKMAKKSSDIVLINMASPAGNSECVYAGFSIATGDACVYMDADLQDPPEVIPDLVNMWLSEKDIEVVYTIRKSRAGESKTKLAFTYLGYKFLRKISNIDIHFNSGDFKLVSRKIYRILSEHQEYKPFMRGIITSLGFKQVPVYYHREPRGDGRKNTKFPFLSPRTVKGWLDSALISFSDMPLKATLGMGLLVSLFSFVYIIVVIIQKILGLYVPGWPAIMATILFLGGIQLFVLGIVGLYINSIFIQTKNRPLYIIRNIVKR